MNTFSKKKKYDIEEFREKKKAEKSELKTKIVKKHINIDSRTRVKEPEIVEGKSIKLGKDPITLKDNMMWIVLPKEERGLLNIDDKISLKGLLPKTVKLNTYVNGVHYLKFTNGSSYVEVLKVYPNIVGTVTERDLSRSLVEISGVRGFTNNNYIGTIPINIINGAHRIYLKNEDTGEISSTGFFIKLPMKFSGTVAKIGYNIEIKFMHYGTIPIYEINARYPIDSNHAKGTHTVKEIYGNSVGVDLPYNSFYPTSFGGDTIFISKVDPITSGFPEPNMYQVKLNPSFTNVISASIVSSQFPNTSKVFRDYPEDTRNNRLYWQNADDGEKVYMIEIPSGNYTPDTLKSTIENQVYKVIKGIDDEAYTNRNYINVDIDTDSNVVTFKSFKEANLNAPIISVSPAITDSVTIINMSRKYEITINHKDHRLLEGDVIRISGAINHLGIKANDINGEHTIKSVPDKNRYTIELSNINLEQSRQATGGGNNFVVYAPNMFRLRFDYPDTIGKELGFRLVGDEIAVTKFSSTITNAEFYNMELGIDTKGNRIVPSPNYLRLSGIDYIFMVCKELSSLDNYQNVENVFTKINLNGLPGRMIFDGHIPIKNTFLKPKKSLNTLNIEFRDPDGKLFDFNGIDHSFVLEVEYIVKSVE